MLLLSDRFGLGLSSQLAKFRWQASKKHGFPCRLRLSWVTRGFCSLLSYLGILSMQRQDVALKATVALALENRL